MEAKIGGRIRSFREKKELTLNQLAERTGLSHAFLKAVEEEDLYPSLGPLLKIARALGLRLGTFLDDQVSRDPLVVRLGERHEELTMHQGRGSKASLRFFSLGKGKTDRHMEPFFIELLPEEGAEHPMSSHEGEEFIVCAKGKVAVAYGPEKTVLGPGDSIYFNSVVPHSVSCEGSEPAEIYAVLYFPE